MKRFLSMLMLASALLLPSTSAMANLLETLTSQLGVSEQQDKPKPPHKFQQNTPKLKQTGKCTNNLKTLSPKTAYNNSPI